MLQEISGDLLPDHRQELKLSLVPLCKWLDLMVALAWKNYFFEALARLQHVRRHVLPL
jgi:hypothetical protein